MGVIYVRPNLINGKQYVGQATNLKVRQRNWNCLTQPYAGSVINAARAKYGIDAFDFEILKECDDKELNKWEMYYIKELNTKVPNGYNMTDGGDGISGFSHSEETREKMSRLKRGENHPNYGKHLSKEVRKKISEGHKGIIFSKEHINKLSESHKGKYLSEEQKIKISEREKGEKHYLYGKHRSEEVRKKISESLKGENHPNYGKHLSSEIRKKISEKNSRAVLKIDPITNEIVAEYPSASEAERQTGFNHISCWCRGLRKPVDGFKWKYKESVA